MCFSLLLLVTFIQHLSEYITFINKRTFCALRKFPLTHSSDENHYVKNPHHSVYLRTAAGKCLYTHGCEVLQLKCFIFFFNLEFMTYIGWTAWANSCVSAKYVWLQGKKEIVAHKTHFWAPFQADLSLSVINIQTYSISQSSHEPR